MVLGVATVVGILATGSRAGTAEDDAATLSQGLGTLSADVLAACAQGTVIPTRDGRDLCALADQTAAIPSVVQNGRDGAAGLDGIDGLPGRDGVDGQDGTDGLPGRDGVDGTPGTNGTDGLDGTPGQDGTDGVDGRDGADAPPPRSIANTTQDPEDPCFLLINYTDGTQDRAGPFCTQQGDTDPPPMTVTPVPQDPAPSSADPAPPASVAPPADQPDDGLLGGLLG